MLSLKNDLPFLCEVPTFVEKYTNGLKEKLAADQTGQSHLVTC